MTKHVVVTGANRGIGLAFVKEYINRGDRVTAVCRHSNPELSGLEGVTVIDEVDVSVADSMLRLSEKIGDRSVDLLINNAGILRGQMLGRIQYDVMMAQYEVNALGPLRITETLLPNMMEKGGKIGLITSRMGSIADNTSGGNYGYRMSKSALNAAGMSLAQDLREANIAVAVLHPGYVQTEMVGFSGEISAEESVLHMSQRIDELNLENSGTFWHAKGSILPW